MGKQAISTAGDQDTGAIIKKALTDGFQEYQKVFQSFPKSEGLVTAETALAEIISGIQYKINYAAMFAGPPVGTAGEGNPASGGDSPMAAAQKAVAPAVMSLARIGGGGGLQSFQSTVLNNLVGETRRQTGVLGKILVAVSPKGSPPPTGRYA